MAVKWHPLFNNPLQLPQRSALAKKATLMKFSPLWLFYSLCLALCLVGCGPAGPKTARTIGKVTYKARPVKFGSIIFQPEAGKVASSVIKSDGTFDLGTNQPGDGAIVGKHRVRVVSLSSQDPNYRVKEGQEMPTGKSLIPEKYADLDTTPLKDYVVEDKPENVFNIELVD
jgi:hypothetical protein